ncbi:hypothetical protein M1105_03260 [Limibaculum sp. FT325]|uniref:hypothetical protein n=1 Tax=Thermohalobaculum sediminis TaxID=2939436 RepID=UPI0020BD5463|nr:hypothetical protein [Limibaculum sediminis]MCL5776020.1 hypothetical protein [Limibaculum sediminis]
MSFIRPAARAVIVRWAESAVAGALAVIAAVEAARLIGRGDVLGWFAALGAVLAALWLRSAVARGLSARAGEAPGLVEIREREIRYFGPLAGGVADLDLIARVEVFVPARGVGTLWRLTVEDGRVMVIPAAAKGAEGLIGAFAALPGFSELAAAAALRREAPGRYAVWSRPGARGAPALSAF